MGDSLSQEIFKDRLLYSVTDEYEYIEKIFHEILNVYTKTDTEVYTFCMKAKRDKGGVVLYGTGTVAPMLERYLEHIRCPIIAYCDADVNKQHIGYKNQKVYSPIELCTMYPEEYILISVNNPILISEIIENLIGMGIQKERIQSGAKYMGIQYFDERIDIPRDREGIFIDGGGLDLSTVLQYFNWTKCNNKQAISFEPDAINYQKCINTLYRCEKTGIKIIPKGLWSKAGTLHFIENGNHMSKITDEETGCVEIDVTSIDEVLEDRKCCFIKLDIEGAELEALKGAEKTIKRDRPILAVCVYHKKEDIWEIPSYILSLVSDYKFFLRPYAPNHEECILYAI